jgi:hypothetical protein
MGVWGAIAQGVLQIGGSVMQGGEARNQAIEQGYEVNADARLRARNIRRLARETRGQADAAYAASGVDVGEGSPLEAQRTITQRSEEDALFTLLGANKQSEELKRQGQAAWNASWLGGGASAISTGAKYGAGGWQTAPKSGTLSSSQITGTQMADATLGAYA